MHPYSEHRQSKVERSRVAKMTKGYATGGAVFSENMGKGKPVKSSGTNGDSASVHGKSVKARQDRPARARGGRLKSGGKTNVNVIIAPQGGQDKPPMMPPPGVAGPMAGPPMAGPAMAKPGMPPMPPGAPMAGGPPGVMPPRSSGGRTYATGGKVRRADGGSVSDAMKGAGKRKLGWEMGANDRGNFGLRDQKTPSEVRGKMQDRMQDAQDISDAVPRKKGGKAYATGGAVKSGRAWEEGRKNGTQVTHTKGKNDIKDMNRPRVVTYKTGGRITSENGPMGPKFDGGAGGGTARKQKEKRAEKKYAKA